MLGAACASLRLHRSQEIEERQQELAEKIQYTNDRISALGLPQFEISDSLVLHTGRTAGHHCRNDQANSC